jgi:predicted RNase H-like HicB family nuclease
MKKYAVVYEKIATGYSAFVPDLPGCVTTAKTQAEAERLIREAIEMHIQNLREHGEPVPEPTSATNYVELGTK